MTKHTKEDNLDKILKKLFRSGELAQETWLVPRSHRQRTNNRVFKINQTKADIEAYTNNKVIKELEKLKQHYDIHSMDNIVWADEIKFIDERIAELRLQHE